MSTYTEDAAAEILRRKLGENRTIYFAIRNVVRSGIARDITAFVIIDGEPVNISYTVAQALGWPFKNNAVRVHGSGMDAGSHTADHLTQALWPGEYQRRLKPVWL